VKKELLLTKIVATLGPSSNSVQVIRELIDEGARAFRINFSHGTFNDYDLLLKNIREASKQTGKYVAVIGDLSGPKIRVGKVEGKGVLLKPGKKVIFTKQDTVSLESDSEVIFSTTYPGFVDEVQAGEAILLDDGSVRLDCVEVKGSGSDKSLVCDVLNEGLITSHKGVNLPDTDLKVSALTGKDKRCIDYAVKNKFDYLALSFVRQAEDIRQLKKILVEYGVRPYESAVKTGKQPDLSIVEGNFEGFIPIIAKIEKPQAIRNLDGILAETDLVMVARGDLGVEMDLAEVAVHQKEIIRKCRQNGVPVIVATQMLQSMIHEPVPTRAEVSDVANAIFDGADAVMLSGETAIGKYPSEVVKMMKRIIIKTNQFLRQGPSHALLDEAYSRIKSRSLALAKGVKNIARDLDVNVVVVWSELGGSAVFLSEQRMNIPIIAFSPNDQTLSLLSLIYAVVPFKMEKPADIDDFFNKAIDILLKEGLVENDEPVIFVHRHPIDQVGLTNEITVKYPSGENFD
jgi:pyruvate kinase